MESDYIGKANEYFLTAQKTKVEKIIAENDEIMKEISDF